MINNEKLQEVYLIIKNKLKTLSKNNLDKLNKDCKLDFKELNLILTNNSINSITSNNKDFNIFIYNKFKNFNSLPLYERLALYHIVPELIKFKD